MLVLPLGSYEFHMFIIQQMNRYLSWFILVMLIFQMFSLSWSISPGTDCNINCGEVVQSVPWFWDQGDKPVVTSTLSFISLLVFIFSEWSVRILPHHLHLFTCPPYFWFHYSIPVIQGLNYIRALGDECTIVFNIKSGLCSFPVSITIPNDIQHCTCLFQHKTQDCCLP